MLKSLVPLFFLITFPRALGISCLQCKDTRFGASFLDGEDCQGIDIDYSILTNPLDYNTTLNGRGLKYVNSECPSDTIGCMYAVTTNLAKNDNDMTAKLFIMTPTGRFRKE